MKRKNTQIKSKLFILFVLRCCSIGVLFLAVGCSNISTRMITSLEDLTSETQPQGYTELNQNRIISISGLLPHISIGSAYFYENNRSPSTAIGLTSTPSFVVESKIEGPGDLSELSDIRTAIIEAKEAAADSVAKRLQVARIHASIATRIAADKDADVAKLEAELSNAEQENLAAKVKFSEKISAATEKVKTPGILVIRWASESDKSWSSKLGHMLRLSSTNEIKTNGFAIIGGIKLQTLFVGPDICNFNPGVEKTWDWMLSFQPPFIGEKRYESVRLTTHVFQTHQILYLQDIDMLQKVQAALKASYSQIKNIGETLKEFDKIEIEAIFLRLDSLSNLGVIGNVKRRVYSAELDPSVLSRENKCLNTAEQIENFKSNAGLEIAARQITGKSLKDQEKESGTNDWSTLYVVDTDLTSLQEAFNPTKLFR